MNNDYRKDVEEVDDEIDRPEEDPVSLLEQKQRELVTSTVDYNLETLSQLIKQKAIDLAPRYQRRFRWDDMRKSRLIESFLMNVPIPPIFLNEDDYGQYSVIDGKQRLASISSFLSGELKLKGLKVFSDLNGLAMEDLPIQFQNSLKIRANIRAIIILRQSNKLIKYEVFQRLNTGGVKLNAQEIRNSAFPGALNDKILELSETSRFHKLLGIKAKSKSKLYQEMRDAELVLRFFALKDTWRTFSGSMKVELDSYLETNRHADAGIIETLAQDFTETIEKVEGIFGRDGSFRRWLPAANKWKQQASVPLFDSQMFSCYGRNREELLNDRERILREFKQLFADDPVFKDSIEASTSYSVKISYRIEALNGIIDRNN